MGGAPFLSAECGSLSEQVRSVVVVPVKRAEPNDAESGIRQIKRWVWPDQHAPVAHVVFSNLSRRALCVQGSFPTHNIRNRCYLDLSNTFDFIYIMQTYCPDSVNN